MPIGVIVNCLGIIIGGILGNFIGPRLSESFKTNLNLVFGAGAMTSHSGCDTSVDSSTACTK